MNATHTPGPWRVDNDCGWVIVAGDGFSIGETSPGNPDDVSEEEAIANAQHIVDCVNACAGVSDDDLAKLLKIGTLGVGGVVYMAAKVNELYEQSDDLLDALAGLYGLLQLFANRDDVPAEVKNFASNHRALDALAVLSRLSEDSVNAYADSRIRADKLHANDGRPDQDMDPGGRSLEGAP